MHRAQSSFTSITFLPCQWHALTLHATPLSHTLRYIKTFHKTLSDTQPVRKAGGGYWIPDRDNTRVKTPPFVHTTTYRYMTSE